MRSKTFVSAILTTLVYRTGAAGAGKVGPDRLLANGQCFRWRPDPAHKAAPASAEHWQGIVAGHVVWLSRKPAGEGVPTDTFTFRVSDGEFTASAVVTVNILPGISGYCNASVAIPTKRSGCAAHHSEIFWF